MLCKMLETYSRRASSQNIWRTAGYRIVSSAARLNFVHHEQIINIL